MISKISDLTILLAIEDSGSFSGAADALGYPVAKVTRSIQRLEKDLNTNLFNRTTRKVEATEECKQFIEQIRVGLEHIEKAEETLKLMQHQPSGRLRIDSASPFILHQLIPIIPAFQQAYPLIKLDLVSSEGFIDLIEKRTDVAIRIGKLVDSNLHSRKLGTSKLRLLASPTYLEQHGIPENIHDLKQHKIVGFSDNEALNTLPLVEKITLPPAITASSGETVMRLCIAGQGIALLSDFMTEDERASGRLVEVLPDALIHPTPREEIHAVYYRNTALSKRISVFLDFICEHCEAFNRGNKK
ncbi:MAG: LysR family transcriptional regulator [Vibrio sp.]